MRALRNILGKNIVGACTMVMATLVFGCGYEPETIESELASLIKRADNLVENAESDSALVVYEEAKKIATSISDMAEIELKEAKTYYYIGDEIMSKQMVRRSLMYYDTLQNANKRDCQNRINALSLYANLMLMSGNEKEALRTHMRIVPLAKEANDIKSFINSKMYVSDSESERGNYISALDGYFEILPYCTAEERFKLYTSLQNAYFCIGDAIESERYLKLMRKLLDKDDIYGNCVVLFAELSYYNLANNKAKIVECIEEMKKYVNIPELSKYYESHIEAALADYYIGVNDRDSASVFIEKVMANAGSRLSEFELYRHLVKIRWYLYDGQNDKAHALLNEKSDDIYKYENVNLYNKYMLLLAELYMKIGLQQKAYLVKRKLFDYNDSLKSEAISHNMAYKLLTLRRDTTILSQRVVMAKKTESMDRLYYLQIFWIVLAILMALIVSISYFAVHLRRLKNRYTKMEEMNDTLQYEVMRQTNMLRLQSEELRQKNEGLRSEIIYASKLQQDILPKENKLDIPCIAEHFILHKPCDMISGDFYWIGTADNKLLLCCGDATGHGIPGTFVAMVCTTILNEQLYTLEEKTPLALINGLNRNLGRVLQNNEDAHTNDSVDLSMLSIDINTGEVTAALARHKLYIIDTNGNIKSLSGVKRSVGDTDVKITQREFEEITVKLNNEDTVYMTTDGFESQFGGPSNTKMKRKNMIEKFIEFHSKPLTEQKEELDKYFESWKGNNEQTDDVLVIGLRFKIS